jgi:hypothetical protein
MHVPPRFACNSRDAIRASGSTMTIIDLAFPLQPAEVPRDHGYALYGALCRAVPELHEARWLGVHRLSGRPFGRR